MFRRMEGVIIYDKTRYGAYPLVYGGYLLGIQLERNRYGMVLSKGTFGIAKGMVLHGKTIPFTE